MDEVINVMRTSFDNVGPHLTRIDAVKYLFFKFAARSFCELLLFDSKTQTYAVPQVALDDPIFDYNKHYYLHIVSVKQEETFFDVTFVADSRDRILIYV